ncbi:MAG: phosphoribosyl transferase domain protein [Satyrvirus sp.]|uniref:Phosphoribosyl transferase domain protein n=1 Tax=Satyrvirus sp. TaxID=2487771 RepID=A0A3G5AEG7_9VIRU|nr:MAG: phosphoribosyl transferase domain protein [Satyrvirus sp.]
MSENWKLVLTKKEIKMYVEKCANVINTKFKGKNIVIVCILKGAVYFYVDLTRKITLPHSCYYIEASSYHDSQRQTKLSIMGSIEPSKFHEKYVILVDELYDNGHTMSQIRTAINEKADVPHDMIYTCTLFKKVKSGSNTNNDSSNSLDLYGVEVPDVWLVGYGLDDKQEKRNWVNLFACPKMDGIPKTVDDMIFENEDFYKKWRQNFVLST